MTMRAVTLLFVVIVLSSCDSFYHLRYRKLDKVPATPVDVAARVEHKQRSSLVPVASIDPVALPGMIAIESETAPLDSLLDSARVVSPLPKERETVTGIQQTVAKEQRIPAAPKRDWSWFIGVLFVMLGIFLLSMAIFVLPYSGMALIPLILLEALFAFMVWRLLGTGITYVVSRFRKKKDNRKES